MRQIVVAKAGGDYSTIQQALDSIPKDNDQWVEILLKPGFYHECLEIETPFIRLIGEDAKTTVISYNNGAATILPDGTRRGTFRSYSVFVGCHDFTAENITFENAAGPGHIAGQSLALCADGDRLAVYQDLTFVRKVDAGQHIHQRGFAAAVFSQQRQNFTTVDVQRNAVVGNDFSESLGDIP